MITLKNLTFAHRRKQNLFDGLELDLAPGYTYGLLGKNGAGKTTLLHLLAGLLFPKSGQLSVMGYEPRRRKLGFLAEVFFLSEDHYVPGEKVSRYVRTNAPFYPNFDRKYFDELLAGFDLEESQRLSDLSFGEQKKAMIAFGLATRCRLLMMDEPTKGLDIPSKKQFRQLVAKAIQPDQIIIISTHQVRDLQRLIDPIIILDSGKILMTESLEGIEQKVGFHFQFSEPAEGEVLYYEEVPGGYMCLRPMGEESESLEVNLEILFNGVIERPEEFQRLFSRTSQEVGLH